MHTTLTTDQVKHLLLQDEYACWTPAQAEALAEYYEELEDSLGRSVELDIVAVRCEWTAYDNRQELEEAYTPEELSWMEDTPSLIECDDDTFLFRN